VYAKLLGEKMEKHQVRAYLVNTGWTGGPYGSGHRIDLPTTRQIITDILSGDIEKAACRTDERFGFEVPLSLHAIDDTLLNPKATWEHPEAYDQAAEKLVGLFQKNFETYQGGYHDLEIYGPK
jgi:phosphoenolpyruvate carboxykinase (ATP)